jgi:hypothetical protein
VEIFFIEFDRNQTKTVENGRQIFVATLSSMATSAPIFMKFATDKHIFVEIFCIEFDRNGTKTVENGRQIFVATLSQVWLPLHRFS